MVNALQTLPGLLADVTNWIRRDTADIDDVSVFDNAADYRAAFGDRVLVADDV